MNKLWMCLLAAMLFSGSAYAQMGGEEEDLEAEIKAEVDDAFEAMDGDSDGKITKAEIKAGAKEEGSADESSMEFIENYGYLLMDFLSADANDDLEVTKAELTASLTKQYEGELVALSKADIKILDEEYYTPGAQVILELVDANGDGSVSKAEAEAAGGEGFAEVDLDGDGVVTKLEMRKSLHSEVEAMYEVPEYEFSEEESAEGDDIPQAARDRFESVDTDKSGKLSKAEIKTAFNPSSKAEWWGVYIAFLSMDANDDMGVDLQEFGAFGKDEEAGVAHKIFPADKDAAMKEIWADLDTDEDGKVTKKEFAAMFPTSNEYEQWDADGDGNVTKDEFFDGLLPNLGDGYEYVDEDKATSDEPKLSAQDKADFESLDGNGDGKINKAEAKAAMGEQENIAYWWGFYIRFLSMDANDDGVVDTAEFASFRADDRAGTKHKLYPADKDAAMDEIWADLDADEDGKVTKEEFGKHFDDASEYDVFDADGDGNATKTEFWDKLMESFSDGFSYEKEDKRTGTGGSESESESAPEEGTGEASDADDAYALYKKVGRSWTLKSTTKMAGMNIVSYNKTEVIKVTDEKAVTKITTMDENKKETFSMESDIPFVDYSDAGGEGEAEVPEIEEETITVEAGEFLCIKITTETAGTKTTSWTSKEHPGLTVKTVSKSDQMETTTELVEFNDG